MKHKIMKWISKWVSKRYFALSVVRQWITSITLGAPSRGLVPFLAQVAHFDADLWWTQHESPNTLCAYSAWVWCPAVHIWVQRWLHLYYIHFWIYQPAFSLVENVESIVAVCAYTWWSPRSAVCINLETPSWSCIKVSSCGALRANTILVSVAVRILVGRGKIVGSHIRTWLVRNVHDAIVIEKTVALITTQAMAPIVPAFTKRIN